MGVQTPRQFTERKVLLVEGRDEELFLQAMLKHLGIRDVQTFEVGGKDQFHVKFPGILGTTGFDGVTLYGVVRDAEDDADATFASVCGMLRKHHEPVPQQPMQFETNGRRTVGVFIMPGNAKSGMLEDLCFASVENHPVAKEAIIYIGALEVVLPVRTSAHSDEAICFPKCRPKAKAKAFMAGLEQDVYNVGRAAEKGYWDFDHAAMADLRTFLLRFAL